MICAGLMISLCALLLWPGDTPWATAGYYGAVWVTVLLILGNYRCRSSQAFAVVTALLTVLTVGGIININYYTVLSGGTSHAPVLLNADSSRAWLDRFLNGSPQPHLEISTYTSLLIPLKKILGNNIAMPMALSCLFTAMAVIICGVISARVSDRSHRDSYIFALAMGLMCCNFYFVAEGTLVLKDAAVCMCTALVVYGLLCMRSQVLCDEFTRGAVALIAGVSILWLVRSSQLVLLIPATLLLARWKSRQHVLVALCVVIALVWVYSLYENRVVSGTVNEMMDQTAIDYHSNVARRVPLVRIMGEEYYDMGPLHKVFILPVTMLIQFLIPFPWNWMRDVSFGPTQVLAHVAYPGYILGALIAWYFVAGLRKGLTLTARVAVAGAVCYAMTALATGGAVSRYVLSFLPMGVPAAVYTFTKCRRTRAFKIYMWLFVAAMCIGLPICYWLQSREGGGL